MASLTRQTSGGVTLLSDETRPSGVTLAFTERSGGVSAAPYASLNPFFTVGEIIEEPLKIHGLFPDKKARRERVYELLEMVGDLIDSQGICLKGVAVCTADK